MATEKTTEKVTLSLDDLEKEKTREPFTTSLRGKVITLNDPADIDWMELAEMGDDPVAFVTACMSDEDADWFAAEPVPSWKVNMLMDAFMQHYGLGSRGKGRRSLRS